jgi:hypothetical protein
MDPFRISNTTIFIIGGTAFGLLIGITIFCICRHQKDMSKNSRTITLGNGQHTVSFTNNAARPINSSAREQLPDVKFPTELFLSPLKLV